jgi:glycosyl transferase family 25
MKMQVAVINLPGSIARREHMCSQFDNLGIDYEFFDAVSGFDGLDAFARYDERSFRVETGRLPTPGEIGCFASHVGVWRRCIAMDVPTLVLEDDAFVTPTFDVAYTLLPSLVDDLGFVRAQRDARRSKRRVTIGRQNGFEWYRYLSFPLGAMCYAITPRVARAFVEHSRVMSRPLDVFIKQFWIHGQPLYGLSPPMAMEGPIGRDSTIVGREPLPSTFELRGRRLMSRLAHVARRERFNMTFTPRPMDRRLSRSLGAIDRARHYSRRETRRGAPRE